MEDNDNDKNQESKSKPLYEKPEIVKVKLNPSQAVLSICHASATTVMDGTIQLCKTGSCRKSSASGDSAGHS